MALDQSLLVPQEQGSPEEDEASDIGATYARKMRLAKMHQNSFEDAGTAAGLPPLDLVARISDLSDNSLQGMLLDRQQGA